MNDADRRRIQARKEQARALILAAKGDRCSRCGRPFEPEQLHMHHRDPSEKKFGIATWTQRPSRSLEHLRRELRKCDPVCIDCHTDEHRDEMKARVAVQARDRQGRFIPKQVAA